jgi:2-polyprenyl-3-methyl-5-hydroxy-6-metoxy-1,4-benzoquinol methylase
MKDIEKKWNSFFDDMARRHGRTATALAYSSDKIYYYVRDAIIVFLERGSAPLKGKMILDSGCGNGLFSEPLVRQNTVLGLDISHEMLKIARTNGLDVTRGSIFDLPYRRESFDIVISAGVLQHIDNAQHVINESARVTKHGGMIVFKTLNSESIARKIYRLFKGGSDTRPYKISDVLTSMKKAGIGRFRIIFFYYPFTHKISLVRKKSGFLNRILSSAFAVVGIRE